MAKILRDERGISPVISTVIIVAVAIAVAMAVAFWMTGVVGIFTGQVEQVQIVAAIPEALEDGAEYSHMIKVTIKNAGTTTVTIDGVFVSPTELQGGWSDIEEDSDSYAEDSLRDLNTIVDETVKIPPGGKVTIFVYIQGASAGQSIEIKLHSASGKEYPKMVTLP